MFEDHCAILQDTANSTNCENTKHFTAFQIVKLQSRKFHILPAEGDLRLLIRGADLRQKQTNGPSLCPVGQRSALLMGASQ